jgi:hypothetical protein
MEGYRDRRQDWTSAAKAHGYLNKYAGQKDHGLINEYAGHALEHKHRLKDRRLCGSICAALRAELVITQSSLATFSKACG